MAVGLFALRVRLHVTAIAEVLMDELALARRHRIERDRPLVAHGVVRRLVGLAMKRLLAAGAIALGVDDDPLALTFAAVHGDAIREVLDRLDRLAVAPDEQAQVCPMHRSRHRVAVADNLDGGVEAQRIHDAVQQFLDELVGVVGHQRLRPNRFFFLRGGGGGAAARGAGFSADAPSSAWSLGLRLPWGAAGRAAAGTGAVAPPAVCTCGAGASRRTTTP